MNSVKYISIFERHLLVGEPKRGEILAELSQHIKELKPDADIIASIGNPNQLARTYNRTHIGLLHSRVLLFLMPLVSIFLAYASAIIAHRLEWVCIPNSYGGCSTPLTIVPFFALAGLLIMICIAIGRALTRMYKRGQNMIMLALILFVVSTGLQLYQDWGSQRGRVYPESIQMDNNGLPLADQYFTEADSVPFNWLFFLSSAALGNGILTLVAIAVLASAMVLTKPFDSWRIRNQGISLFLEGMLSVFAVAGLHWFCVDATMAIFSPDVVRTYSGSPLVRLLGSKFGRFLPALVLEIPLIIYLWRRVTRRWKMLSTNPIQKSTPI